MADPIGKNKAAGTAAPFNFPQFVQAPGAPKLESRPTSSEASLTAGAAVPSRGKGTEPQFRAGSAASGRASNSSATASQLTPTPLGHIRGIPIFWGEACGHAAPAGIVLRTGSIAKSPAQVLLIPSQGGTFDAIHKLLGATDQKQFDVAAKRASERAKANGAGAYPHSLTISNTPREIVLVKVPEEDGKKPSGRMALALTDAASTPALTASQHTTLATTWLGAGRADAGNIYSQAQLETLCDWLQAQPGRSVEICDIEAKRFSPLCQYLSNPASLPQADRTRIHDYAQWMEKKDPAVKQLGWLKPPGAQPIPVWAFAGQQGKENPGQIKGKTGLILAFDVDATQLPDTAFLYAHKPGLEIGKAGMAGVLRKMAEGSEVIGDCNAALSAAAGKGNKALQDAQAVLVPLPGQAGKLKGKAIILVNGPKVGDATTTPEHAQLLEKSIDNAIEQARTKQIRSVALTGISTGEFGFNKAWGGNLIMQSGLRALQAGELDTVISCFWVDKGLSLEESVAGGALTAVLANPWFEPV